MAERISCPGPDRPCVPVRVGVVGLGNMGSTHARAIQEGRVPRLALAAVCDADPERLAGWSASVPVFTRLRDLLRARLVDAVVIATPHEDHPASGRAALAAGLSVLVEKPLAAQVASARRLLDTPRRPGQVFAVMLNQRTDPCYRALKRLLDEGGLGRVQRAQWTITDWYRTEAYYRSGTWRATWRGEGGGVLLNQCPHNLDLLQWFLGMPVRVQAFAGFGKYHDIEVEDEVTAYLEFAHGATATFITSTGETPGTNRLEIAGDRGRVVCEAGRLSFLRNEVDAREHLRTCPQPFDRPAVQEVPLPPLGQGGQHLEILANFADAILDGAPLIAPAEDGLPSLELANAMLLSAARGRPVSLPLSAASYARWLARKRASGRALRAPAATARPADLSASFPTGKAP